MTMEEIKSYCCCGDSDAEEEEQEETSFIQVRRTLSYSDYCTLMNHKVEFGFSGSINLSVKLSTESFGLIVKY